MDGKGKSKMPPNDDDHNPNPKRTRPSSSSGIGDRSVAEDEHVLEFLSRIQPILSNWVEVGVINALQTHFHPLLELLRERIESGEEAIVEGGVEKFKLVFCNQPASTIFTNNKIKAENGEALVVAICDATTNDIIRTGLMASAAVELGLVNGDYDGTNRSVSELNRNVLSAREGKRPLMHGDGTKFLLENGYAPINCVCITDNSSWTKSKKFRIIAKIIDEKILAMFPTIGVAVSQSFRVMDHRGEVNKKHHPPSREDEVWRLEGIGKDGAYHKNLSSHGIKNVGDFLLKYHEIGSALLKKLLGNKVPDKTWTMMVENAFECQSYTRYEPLSETYLLSNNVMEDRAYNEVLDILEPNNLDHLCLECGLADSRPLLTGEASTLCEAAAATTVCSHNYANTHTDQRPLTK
ncbi:calmodulin-binding protein 60 G-like [Cucurbita moschata]|uniref:Calmodulin-binding protein 60 G-like n=1 Tax=Cucurbita moschata TaxID=3662 RepID=A0A6J1HA30_CUCMO|nr:calmodulin-binding protein 60 G-like [Cucurbita moschata]